MFLFMVLSLLLFISCNEEDIKITTKKLYSITEKSYIEDTLYNTLLTTYINENTIIEINRPAQLNYDTTAIYNISDMTNYLKVTNPLGSENSFQIFSHNGILEKIVTEINFYQFPYNYEFTETRLFKRNESEFPKDFYFRFNGGLSPHRTYENGLHNFEYNDGKLVKMSGYPEDTTLDYFSFYKNLQLEIIYQEVGYDLDYLEVDQINSLLLERHNYYNSSYYLDYFLNLMGLYIYNQPNNSKLIKEMKIFNGYQNFTYKCEYTITNNSVNKILTDVISSDNMKIGEYEISLEYK